MQVKKKSQLQEKSVAKDLNAKTVVASGALWGAKGDVRSDKYLIECKTTDKPYYSLTLATWEKIEKEATRDGLRIPVMCIDVNGGKDRYAVFLSKHFQHYKSFCEIDDGDGSWTNKKSFRVSCPEHILVLSVQDKKGESPWFSVVPWNDFLYMLKNGEK